MNKSMDNKLRAKILKYIKNGMDISDLIKDVDIAGEDFSRAIIKEFYRPGDDISNCNFTNAVIGEAGKTINISRAKAVGCNFKGATFPGLVMARRTDLRNCNFTSTNIPNSDYKFADLRGSDFCNTIFCIGTKRSYGAKFDKKFFKDLAKFWGVDITINEEKCKDDGTIN